MKQYYCPRCKTELKIPEEEGIIFSGNCPYCYDCRDGLITQLHPIDKLKNQTQKKRAEPFSGVISKEEENEVLLVGLKRDIKQKIATLKMSRMREDTYLNYILAVLERAIPEN